MKPPSKQFNHTFLSVMIVTTIENRETVPLTVTSLCWSCYGYYIWGDLHYYLSLKEFYIWWTCNCLHLTSKISVHRLSDLCKLINNNYFRFFSLSLDLVFITFAIICHFISLKVMLKRKIWCESVEKRNPFLLSLVMKEKKKKKTKGKK